MLLYTDHHVHTKFSPDSEAKIQPYLQRAKELGHKYVMFTDHVDFGIPDPAGNERIDYEEYFQVMKDWELKCGIPIRVGVEIGYDLDCKKEISEFLKAYPFHFVIASVHHGDGKYFFTGDFFRGKTQHRAYERYFEIVLEMVENFSDFDVVGHLDFITRYGGFDPQFYEYDQYRKIIDAILKKLIEKGKGLEVNTSGLREGQNVTFPKDEVLSRYRELGGRILTVGSDCHVNENYYAGVAASIEKLKILGFKEIFSFKQRIPQPEKI